MASAIWCLSLIVFDGRTALNCYISSEATKLPRLLIKETERADLGWYRGSKEGFSLWQQALDPFHYQKPLAERIEVAVAIDAKPDALRLSVALGPLPPLAHSISDRRGRTLLHAVAIGMGRRLCWNGSDLMEVSCHGFVKDENGMRAKQCALKVSDLLLNK